MRVGNSIMRYQIVLKHDNIEIYRSDVMEEDSTPGAFGSTKLAKSVTTHLVQHLSRVSADFLVGDTIIIEEVNPTVDPTMEHILDRDDPEAYALQCRKCG